MTSGAEAGRLTRPETFGWAFIALTVVFVFFVGGTYPWLGSPVVRAITQVLIGLLVAGLLVIAWRRPSWSPPTEVAWYVAPGLVAGLVSVVGATSPRLAIEAVYWAAVAAGLLVVLTSVARQPALRQRLASLVVVLFVVVLVAYLAQYLAWWVEFSTVVGRLTLPVARSGGASLTFGASPIVGIVLAALGPPTAAVLLSSPRGRRAIGPLVALASVAVLATASRSALLGAAAELAAVAVLVGRASISQRLRSTSLRQLAVAGVAGLLVVGAALRFLAPRLLDSATLAERLDIWRSAWSIWLASPIVGAGAGTWPYLRAGAYPTDVPSLIVPHAHNPLIQLLAETGLVGLCAVTVSLVLLIRGVVRRGRDGDVATRRMARAVLVSLAGFGAVSLLDSYVNLNTVLLALALPLALVLGVPTKPATAGPTGAHRSRLAGAGLGLAALATAVLPLGSASLAADAGVRSADRSDWATAIERFEEAGRLDPHMPLYRYETAVALAMLGRRDEAWATFEPLGQADGTPTSLLTRAWLARGVGEASESERMVRLAYERSAADVVALVNVGELSLRLGLTDLATNAFVDAVLVRPALVDGAYLASTGLAGTVAAKAREQALAGPDPYLADLLRAHAGEAGAAVTSLEAMPPGPGRDRALATCLALTGRYADATTLLVARLAGDPIDGITAAHLASIRLAAGDSAGAARFGRWAELAGYGSAALGVVFGDTVTTVGEAGTSNLATNYPWVIYWRFGPRVMSPPDALAIVPP